MVDLISCELFERNMFVSQDILNHLYYLTITKKHQYIRKLHNESYFYKNFKVKSKIKWRTVEK